MMDTVSYGIGGFLPDHPNGNIVARTVDNGDGTGTRTTYDADGQVTGTEALSGLPIPVPDTPSMDEQVAELQATVTEQAAAMTALLALLEG